MKLPLVFPLSLSSFLLASSEICSFPRVPEARKKGGGNYSARFFRSGNRASVSVRSLLSSRERLIAFLKCHIGLTGAREGEREKERDEEERQLGGKLFSPARQRARRKTEILSPAPLFPLGQKGKIISRPHYLVWGIICSSRCSPREKEGAFCHDI